MTREDFIARMKLRGYRMSQIEALADFAQVRGNMGIGFSESWFLQDMFDTCRSGGGISEALRLIGWEKKK